MANNRRVDGTIRRDLYVLEDETNPRGSRVDNVLPSTILDQVYDDQSPTKKNLREILEELRQEIITGGRGNIEFPVTSVNGKTDDVILNKEDIGLGRVDNTKDIDKPLSTPQKNAVMELIKGYDFKVNLDELYNHLIDTNNPHNVTIDQINKDDMLASFVKMYISKHSLTTNNTVHPDIRNSLHRLWTLVDTMNNSVEYNVEKVLQAIDEHYKDDLAHLNLFDRKENISNKVIEFNNDTNCDHTKYPSTRAVVEFVAQKIIEFNKTLPDVKQWVDDISVINSRADLPEASATTFRKAYLIRYGNGSFSEIAVCRMNSDRISYDWDISDFGSYSKYNPEHFSDSIDGLSLRMDNLVSTIMDIILEKDGGLLDTSLSETLKNYYTKFDIDSFQFVYQIKILPGTQDGTIRYYVNNNMGTMSEDVPVAGLKRLAYMEYVTSDVIWDNAVHENHIVHKAIGRKHIQDRAVAEKNIECEYGCVIGNNQDPDLNTANYIPMERLAKDLSPYIEGGSGGTGSADKITWNNNTLIQLFQTHRWYPDYEYDMGNGSYGRRFKGTVTEIADSVNKLQLATDITSNTIQLIDAGGSWQYSSNPVEWCQLGGSNTFVDGVIDGITVTQSGVYFQSVSAVDRTDAQYDIWIKYFKLDEIDKYPPIYPDGVTPPDIDVSKLWPKNDVEGLKIALGMHVAEPIPEESIRDIMNNNTMSINKSIAYSTPIVNTTGEVDLSGYWSKNEIPEMKEVLGIHDSNPITNDLVIDVVDDVFDDGIRNNSNNQSISINASSMNSVSESIDTTVSNEYWTIDDIEEMKVALGLHDAEPISEEKISEIISNS